MSFWNVLKNILVHMKMEKKQKNKEHAKLNGTDK